MNIPFEERSPSPINHIPALELSEKSMLCNFQIGAQIGLPSPRKNHIAMPLPLVLHTT